MSRWNEKAMSAEAGGRPAEAQQRRVPLARAVRALACAAGVVLLCSGCATHMLWEATSYRPGHHSKADWSLREVRSAHIGPEQMLLVGFDAIAPRKRNVRSYTCMIEYGTIVAALREGRIEHRDALDGQVEESLTWPSATEPRASGGMRGFDSRHPQARDYGLYPPRRHQRFPLALPEGAIREGTAEVVLRDQEGEWVSIPIHRYEEPIMDGCSWDQLRRLPPAEEVRGRLDQGFAYLRSTAFAYTAHEPVVGGNYSIAFGYLPPLRYQAWYQSKGMVAFRVFLPVTVAWDVVTLPIQIPMVIHAIDEGMF